MNGVSKTKHINLFLQSFLLILFSFGDLSVEKIALCLRRARCGYNRYDFISAAGAYFSCHG